MGNPLLCLDHPPVALHNDGIEQSHDRAARIVADAEADVKNGNIVNFEVDCRYADFAPKWQPHSQSCGGTAPCLSRHPIHGLLLLIFFH